MTTTTSSLVTTSPVNTTPSKSNPMSWLQSSNTGGTGGGIGGIGTGGTGGGEMDERRLAKSSLDAAEDALESLCAAHAGTFVAVEKRSRNMEIALLELQKTIERIQIGPVLDSVQQAQSETEPASLVALSEKHRIRRRTLLQHSTLLELFELPSLMDACVRSNLYEQALSIASLANTLERRRGDSVVPSSITAAAGGTTSTTGGGGGGDAVISHVVKQIRSRQDDLKRHLLHRLEGSVTMPDCLEVVTALRRLNNIDLENMHQQQQGGKDEMERLYRAMEIKLQIDFLEARNTWLDATTTTTTNTSFKFHPNNQQQQLLSALTSSAEDMLDTIERYRTRVFEVATQFNAIFRANPRAEGWISADLMAMWTCRRLQAFLQLLNQAMAVSLTESSFGGTATLRDWFEATLFFSTSMGRLGADFTAHQIPNLFENYLVQWIVQHCWIQQGVKPLVEILNLSMEANVATPLLATTTTTSRSATTQQQQTSTAIVWSLASSQAISQLFQDFVLPSEAKELLEQPLAPLRVLLQLPPLGRFVNAILHGLNELRRCLFPSAIPRLWNALETMVLNVITKELKLLERQLITQSGGKDRILREIITLEYIPLWNNVIMSFCRASFWTAIGRATPAWQEYQAARKAIDQNINTKFKLEQEKMQQQQQQEDEKEEDDEDEPVEPENVDTTNVDHDNANGEEPES